MRENAIKMRNEHCCRLNKIIAWWRMEYPDYFEVGTKVLSQQDRDDAILYYHKCDRDIVYKGLRVDMVLLAYIWRETSTHQTVSSICTRT